MLTCKRSQFSIPPKVTYLNCGYMSPLPKDSEKAALKSLRRKRNPASITQADFFSESNELRNEFARLIHLSDPQRVAIIPSVSYGLSTVAHNLKVGKGDRIIVAAEQFPSNYYPWQRLAQEKSAEVITVAAPPDAEGRGKKWNERILNAIDHSTKAVAIGNIHWVDGTLFNLKEIRKRTRDVGALLIIDGTQSVGALPFDVSVLQPDALVCAGYKWLLGSYSLGLAYYGEYFDDGKPIEESWMNRMNSEDFTRLDYQSEYQPGVLRYEVGEHSNFILVSMLLRSLKLINRWKPENIHEYCRHITGPAIDRLREHGYWIESEGDRSSHLFGVRFNHRDPEKLKKLLLEHKVYVSFRGNAIRVSSHVFNDEKDLAKLVGVLTKK